MSLCVENCNTTVRIITTESKPSFKFLYSSVLALTCCVCKGGCLRLSVGIIPFSDWTAIAL